MPGSALNLNLKIAQLSTLLALMAALSAYAQTAVSTPVQAPTSAPAQSAPTPLTADPADSADAAPTPTIQINSRLVAVSAVVRDKAGQPVSGLTRDDLLLKQDGKPQAITYFSQGSSLPLTLALMVDTSGSQRAFIADEVAAGKAFFPACSPGPTTAPSSSSSTAPSCSSSR
jgi:hypothetical protein